MTSQRKEEQAAHADRAELFRWLAGFQQKPGHTYAAHGEPHGPKDFVTAVGELPLKSLMKVSTQTHRGVPFCW